MNRESRTAAAAWIGALLLAAQAALAQNGIWANLASGDASGSWAAAANWNNGVIADGVANTADFSTLDLTTNAFVTLDGARTIGHLRFGDTTPSTNWFLNTGAAGPLTLSVTAGSPTITVNNQTATIGAVLSGVSGFTMTGGGTLALTNTGNNFTGDIIVAQGILRAADPAGAAGARLVLGAATSSGVNLVTVSNAGTLQLAANAQINNKQARISGAGADGTQGAFYVSNAGTGNGTRWGVGGAAALDPFLTLDSDATIRVDGDATGANTASFLLRTINLNGFTLTKTGSGRLTFDNANGVSGDGSVRVVAGVLGYRGGTFTANRSLVIDAGAEARIGGDNNAMNSTVNRVTVNGKLDLNARGTGAAGSDTTTFSQTIGTLSGSGTITTGTFGNNGTQNLTVSHDTTNGAFSGTITEVNGTLNLTKAGANTLRLSGTNSYRGATTINAGVLLINGTHTNGGAYTIGASGTLGGLGVISSVITNNGILQAGDPDVAGSTLTVGNVLGNGADMIIISNAALNVVGKIGDTGIPSGSLFMTNGTLDLPLRTLGPSVFVSALTVDGNAKIKFSVGTPLLGRFPIISCLSLGGSAGFSGLALISPAGITATLSNNTANATIDVVITSILALTWTGTPNGIWNIGSVNWQGGAAYTEPGGVGLFVTFDDTASGTTSVDLAATLSPKGVTLNNSSKNYTFSGSGKLSGATGIAKSGSGTLIVANSGNDFSGGVNLQQGTVQVGNGGTTGDLGSGAIANQGTLALNRSDSFTLANTVGGNGAVTKAGAGTATIPVSGDSTGAVTVNSGTLLLGPSGTTKLSGNVTGSGAFGVNGSGTVVLSSLNNTYAGGTVISNGTLQFGDELSSGTLPPASNITDNGTLATTISGTLANNISGVGGLSIISNSAITLSGANSYTGPTVVLGGSVDATASGYPSGSMLRLGSQTGTAEIGTANFTAGGPVLGGLRAGGNNGAGNRVNLTAGGQTLSINGDLRIGNVGPVGASVLLQVTGTGASVMVNTNGGTIQIGLGAAGSGVNPDNVLVDFSGIDKFVANLGATGLVNLGTLDGNPGPPAGATVVNQFKLAAVSNSITAGTITIGAGGRQLVPELRLGAGTNIINTDLLRLGAGGRDGGYLLFDGAAGGVRVRAADGISRANMNVGVAVTTTGAAITNTVDLTGHTADLLLGSLVIGSLNNVGAYQCTFSFDQGVLDAASTSLAALRNNNGTPGIATLSIGGGTASLGPVSLTASAGQGTLNINNATVTVANITSAGAGAATLDINNSTLNLALGPSGNPVAAPVAVDTFNANGTVNLGFSGSGFTVGQFPLISYAGSIGGSGFSALNLTSRPSGVSASLVNNSGNQTVDVLVTAAPPAINPNPTNILVSLSGNQLTLGWPSSHLGWLLQTNSVSLANTGAWVTVTGSGSTNQFTTTVDTSKTNVFFRMLKP